MSVYEALMPMIAFATLVMRLLDDKDNKKTTIYSTFAGS